MLVRLLGEREEHCGKAPGPRLDEAREEADPGKGGGQGRRSQAINLGTGEGELRVAGRGSRRGPQSGAGLRTLEHGS